MKDLSDRLAALSPQQRAMFELLRSKQQKQQKPAAGPPQGPIPRRGLPGPAPLSFDQERLWFLHQLDPRETVYNLGTVTRIRGRLDLPRLTAALNEVVRRHESWRTVFPAADGRPVQVVLPRLALRVPLVDVRGLPAERRRAPAREIAREMTHQPFNFDRGPLIRAALVRLGEEVHDCVLVAHHIVHDWLSAQVAWDELGTIYLALLAGKPSPLPEPPVQYADFAVWQREWMQGEALQRSLDFWIGEIAGAPHALELPTDRPRPPFQTTRGGQAPLRVPADRAEALRALARRERATSFMALLAAYGALLHRLTGEAKILISAPNANRNRPEIQQLIGFFLTQLVFAVDLAGDPTFRELLVRVRGAALRSFTHQDLPFGKLVEAVRPERDPSRAPLVQVNLLLLDAETSGIEMPGLSLETVPLEEEVAKFDLGLGLLDGSGGITGSIEHNRDLFDGTTAARLARAFEIVVEQVGWNPEIRISELRLLDDGALHQVLHEWNDTKVSEPALPVYRLVEEQAARTPGALALLTSDGATTYGELNRRAGLLAAWLRRLGIGPEARVGLCVERTADVAIGMLGVWKAGAAWVPLDPAYPADRLAYILDDAGLAAIVTRPGPAARLPETPTPIVSLDLLERSTEPASPGPSPPGPLSHTHSHPPGRGGTPSLLGVEPLGGGAPSPGGREGVWERGSGGEGPGEAGSLRDTALAYVIYTSGTTGRPKGVMVEHGNLAHALRASRREFGWTAADRIPVLAPFSFDIFLFELWSPLTAGGTAELVPLAPALDLPWLMASLGRATRLHAVPALMRQIVALTRAEGKRWPGVRTVFVGGDAVPPELLAELPEVFPAAEIRVLYGPTEGTIICASFRANDIPWRNHGPKALLGRPLPDAEIRLVDRAGGLAAIGVPGELWIGGPGVTRGYLGREELTAEKYVEREGRRWYRTGDLARWLPDGLLEFLGRADDQVKVRGFRIEPGEIETALLEHPAVREAVVLAAPVEGGDKRLVAYVVSDAGGWGEVAEETVRAALSRRLPEHMVPGLFVPLPALPLTGHGKVDRRALLKLAAGAEAPGPVDATPPRTPAEEVLAEIWSGLLGAGRIGVHDNFFRLGGDSILGIQVVARARQAGLALTPRQIFEHQTIAALAAVAQPVAAVGEPEAGLEEGETPLTPVQLRFFDEDPVDPEWFNQALLLSVREALDPAVLEQALAALVERHEALRWSLSFDLSSAWVRPAVASPFLQVDLSAVPGEIFSSAVEAASAQLQTAFDLQNGPVFLGTLFSRAVDKRLLLAAHHLVIDAYSWRILLADLQTAYGQLAAGAPVDLPPRSTSWKRWAERLAEQARSAAVRRELEHWLAVPAPGELPADLPGASEDDTVGAAEILSVELPAAATAALLREAPAPYHARVDDLLLTALALAFARWTGQPRLVLELEGHGREEGAMGGEIDLSRTVGWFTAVFPVALDLTGAPGPGEAIKAVKEQLRGVPGKGLGYGLLRYLSRDQNLAARPEPQVGFNYLGQLDSTLPAGGAFTPAPESSGPVRSPRARRRHRIDVDAHVWEGRLRIDLTYAARLFSRESMERLARELSAALDELIAHCLSPAAGGWTPSDFPLARLRQEALDRLVGDGPAVEDVYPLAPLQSGMLFHSLYTPGSEIYFEQLTATLRGGLDAEIFARAWQAVADRQAALRTAFAWEGLERPLQVVRRGVEIPWVLEDWRGETDPAARFQATVWADQDQGFDLTRAPLLRLRLIRTGDAEHRLLWSFHHLLFDGWCFPILFREVFSFYEAFRRGAAPSLPPVRPYRDFLAWLERQDPARAERFWRTRLAGADLPTPVPLDDPEAPAGRAVRDFREVEIRLAEPLARDLARLARAEGLTLNTLLQGAWALLLARWSGRRDVVFGAVAAGRPAELPGVESMVGLFINTLPVRVSVDPQAPLLAWLRRLQEEQAEQRAFDWSPLADVQRWSGAPAGAPLFHSLLVFENYPIDPSLGDHLGALEVLDARVSERSNYPLTLAAVVRDDFLLRLGFDARVAPETAERMLAQLAGLLTAVAADPGRLLGALPALEGEAELRERAARCVHLAVVPEIHPAEPPRNAMEETLVRVWRSVLRLERIGIRDDFFRLGGDSILSLQILARARQEGLALTPRDIFENPTVAALAAVARPAAERAGEERPEGRAGDQAVLDTLLSGDRSVEDVYPVAPLQSGMIFHSLFAPGSEIYFEQLTATLRGPLDPGAFVRAWEAVVGRQPVLRTAYAWEGLEQPLQIVRRGVSIPWILEDWRGEADPDARLRDLAAADRARGFDLTAAPLLRFALLRTGETEHRLLWSFHHLLFDGWCFSLLFREVFLLYESFRRGTPLEAAALGPVRPYRAYIDWLARQDAGRAEAFWRRRLAGVTGATPVPFDHPLEPAGRSAEDFQVAERSFPAALTGALARLAQNAGLTLNTVVQGAWSLLLSRWSGRREVVFGAVTAGRPAELPGVESMIGLFINTLPVRVEIEPEAPFLPWLRRLQEEQVEQRAFEWSPLADVQRWSGAAPGAPLFHSLVVFHNYPVDSSLGDRPGDLEIHGVRVLERTNYPLTLGVEVRGELQVGLSHDRRIAPETAERMLDQLEAVLGALAEDAGRTLGSLPVLPGEDVLRGLTQEEERTVSAEGAEPLAPEPPRNAVEAALIRVWRSVLRLERIGIRDDFFRLGGDSILSLQIVARARQEGLALTPREIFGNPTIAALAAVARPVTARAGEERAEGEVALTPVQRFFLEQAPPDPHWFNQSLLLAAREPVDPGLLARAVALLPERHDALRWTLAGSKGWIRPAASLPFLHVDLSSLPEESFSIAVEAASAQFQTAFDLQNGPLFLAAWFSGGGSSPLGGGGLEQGGGTHRPGALERKGSGRLFLAAQHLVIDAVSWRILLEDLESAYRQMEAGVAVLLPSRTTSWQRWAGQLAEHARGEAVQDELAFWLGAAPGAPLPVDRPEGENTVGAAASVSVELSAEATEALLRQAPAAWRTRVDELLLAALARTVTRWTGAPRVRIDLEGHGREEIAPGIDLSRTAGWFTALYPVTLDLAGAEAAGEAVRTVKEQVRAVPGHGLGWGLLRWLGDPAAAARLAALPPAELAFNYLGQLDGALGDGGRWEPAPEGTGLPQSPRAPRTHLLEVNALIFGGRLRVDWGYASRHDRATVERLAASFRADLEEILAACLETGAGGWTPSDFPLARLDQPALDVLLGGDRSVEDVYPVAPLQSGMIFHTLFAPGSEVYFEQLTATLQGSLDPEAFVRAWDTVAERQPVLRTAYAWEGLEQPLQIVRRKVSIPWTLEDWRGEADPAARLRDLAAADRARGFDLTAPPLLRFALLRTGETEHRLVWSFHHLLFDGWCFSLLLREVFLLYESFRRGTPLEAAAPAALGPVRPYRDYVAWLARQDPNRAEAFWRQRLAGVTAATPLPLDHPREPAGRSAEDFQVAERSLPAPLAGSLARLAQNAGLTLNTVVQGAWSLLLARWSGRRDVLFGAVTAGRPAELPGIESMIGLFINTLPVRVEVEPEAPFLPWLRRLQEEQVEQRSFEWSPLADVQRWSGAAPGAPLFHSLVVFENYPVDPSLGDGLEELEIRDVSVSERTNYPLTLGVMAREEIHFGLSHDRRVAPETAERMLAQLEAVLSALAEDPERTLGSLPVLPGEDALRGLVWEDDARTLVAAEAPAPEPPRNAVEATLTRVWRSVLRLEQIGIRDDFFRLGGDSILSLQIVARARQEGLALTPRQIFEHPTIAGLATMARPAAESAGEERPAYRLDQAALDILLAGDRSAEDVYPVALLQSGMIFHTLFAPGSEIYFEQLTATLQGPLDPDAFVRAWEAVAERQPVLRTSYAWEGLEQPLQIVHRDVSIPWTLEDWRGEADPVARLRGLAAADRARGFDLKAAPLLRFALLRTGEAEHRLLWSFHHLLFDGWCFSLLFREVFLLYGSFRRGTPLEAGALGPVRPYRDYVDWLAQQDANRAEAFWRQRLAGVTGATPVPFDHPREPAGWSAEDFHRAERSLPAALAGAVARLAQNAGLTLNTVVQGAWALLLARWSGRRDVLFGAVTAGRPAELPGIESMIGLFINTLPVRVEVEPEAPVLPWLRRLQEEQVEQRSFEWSPLADVQRWSGAAPGAPLFHSLVVFENYPVDPSLGEGLEELEIHDAKLSERSNYPLTLGVMAHEDFHLSLSHDRRIAPETAERMLAQLEALLSVLAEAPGRTLGSLPALPDEDLLRGLVQAEETRTAEAVEIVIPAPEPPRNAVEEALARHWRSVLRREGVSIHDDFFRLGGDSILSLQIVARARQEGLVLTPRQIFENPTIAGLAAVATLAGASDGEARAEGEAALTPVQCLFLEQAPPDPHWSNQSLLLAAREADPALLARAVALLPDRHDALRWTLAVAPEALTPGPSPASGRGVNGAWIRPVAEIPFLHVDLSALPEEAFSPAVEGACAQLQTAFDLHRGPLFLAAWFSRAVHPSPARGRGAGGEGSGRLFLAAHHLVIDAVSWRILLEDLQTAYQQMEAGVAVLLPARTTSWQRWAGRLAEHARGEEVQAELGFWLGAAPGAPLPVDRPDGANTVGAGASVSVELSPEATEALLRQAPAAWRTRVDELLLAALARTVTRWTGAPRVRIDLEGHGREEIAPGIDLSRTVGWFTAVYPVTLDLAEAEAAGEAVRTVKEQLRAVPGRGLGWGLLRWLGDPADAARLAALPPAELAFNYLGQLDGVLGDGGRWEPAPEGTGLPQSPRAPRAHLLEVNALIFGGRLRVDWGYAGRHDHATVERLAAGFRSDLEGVLAACLEPGAGGWTPSDFPLARLDQAALDVLLKGDRSVEDVYPVAPLQSGMIFHTLFAPGSEIYFEQLTATLQGPLDPDAFVRAWEAVAERQPVLRTSYAWEGLEQPLQIVRRTVSIPWTLEDWRGEADPAARLRDLAAADRARGFDLKAAPLLRFALLRTGEAEHRLLWSFHHLLFDGWCLSLLLREVFLLYESFRRDMPLEPAALGPVRPYRDYVAWLARQDAGRAEAFWRQRLAGVTAATPVPFDHPREPAGRSAEDFRVAERLLSALLTGSLARLAQDAGLTLNTVVQGAWSLLLSRWSGRRDVVFGAVTAGRPAELPGIESMIGLFINTLPVRVEVEPEAPALPWLRRLQEEQVEQRAFEWSPLADVQRWSGAAPGAPLFQSLVVFENYPVDPSLGEELEGLEIHDARISERSNYPLTLGVMAREEIHLGLSHDRRIAPETAERMLAQLEAVLSALAEDPRRTLASLPVLPGEDLLRGLVQAEEARAAAVSGTGSPAPELPRNAAEETLARLWRSVLRREQISIHDDFFRLGGDSILSLQIVVRAREEGLVLTPRQIFENPTIAGLAAVATPVSAEETPPAAAAAPLVELDPEVREALVGGGPPVEDLYPLAPLQKGLLLHGLYAPDSDHYLEQLSCALGGDLDPEAFRRAWQHTVDRHAALRTAFAWQGLDEPLQVVRRGVEIPWENEDWRGLPVEEREVRWRERVAADRRRVFALDQAPLQRFLLVRTAGDEHRFLWTFHHLLFDGWCFALIFRDVFALYEAFRQGEEPRLAEPRPYRDFIAWVVERPVALNEAWWRRHLEGFAAPTPLPLDVPGAPPDEPGMPEPGERLHWLSPDAAAALGAFAQSRRLTLNTLFQGAWALLLSRYGAGRDVVFGSVVAGRPPELPGVETMVGLFINTLPLRLDVDPEAPAAAWLRGVQEAQLDLRPHEHVPIADIQGWSGLPPGESLFRSLTVFEKFPFEEAVSRAAQQLEIRDLLMRDHTDVPLSAAATPAAEGLSLGISHDHQTEPATADRLLRHLETLLVGLAADPGRPLRDVPLLGEAERSQLLAWGEEGWRMERPAPEEGLPVHALFARRAAERPEAPALVERDGAVTSYGELARRAGRLAGALRGMGVGPEVRVGLWLERSPRMVEAVLAVHLAGGAYVPIDPEAPPERAALLLEDSGALLLLTEKALAAALPRVGARVVLLEEPLPSLKSLPSFELPSLDHLAYVLYTSGSTGTPKGVLITHRSFAAYVRAVCAIYGLGPDDRTIQFSSLSFDASAEEIYSTLSVGASLMIRSGPAEDAATFLRRSSELGLTLLTLPTAYWHLLAAALDAGEVEWPAGIRLITMGGERALPERWAAWGRRPGLRPRLINGYGPTETTVGAVFHEHPGGPLPAAAAYREVPIGRPIPGYRAHVLDAELRPLPVGAVGELFLGGTGLARGYLGDPVRTAERFVPDPLSRGGERFYRTGDRVRRWPDGTLEFLGRVDTQVKVRGFRIELGEIEAALTAHPDVREAAAATRPDASGNARLVAFVVWRDGEGDLAGLQIALQRRLPAWMVPSEIVSLPALPLTPAGKLDRRALERLVPAPDGAREIRPPSNPLEEGLAEIWRELLGAQEVGLDDDFFALGGNSLLATQLVTRVRQYFGVELPLHRLFELRTLEELARDVLVRTLDDEIPD